MERFVTSEHSIKKSILRNNPLDWIGLEIGVKSAIVSVYTVAQSLVYSVMALTRTRSSSRKTVSRINYSVDLTTYSEMDLGKV